MKSTTSLLSLTVCLCLLLGYNFMSAAWTAPTGTPPANNAEAPINVSDTTQTKAGRLNIQSGSSMTTAVSAVMFRTNGTAWANMQVASVEMRSPRYCDELGANCVADVQGRVSGTCPAGQAIRTINSNGTVTCEAVSASGGLSYGGTYVQAGSCSSGNYVSCSMGTSPSCAAANPATGACSCPAGFTAQILASNLSTVSCTKSEDSDTTCSPGAPRRIVNCYK